MGHAKIAWTYAFKFVYNSVKKSPQDKITNVYYKFMKFILQKGGDSDTNGAIVGAMMGALLGYHQIPSQYTEKLLTCNLEKSKIVRPLRFYPHRALLVTKQLLKYSKP